ncbi:MAG: hypothetical protein ACEQSB_05030 [Undibacterium sp.]
MSSPKPFRLIDLLRSIVLGVLLGWLFVSISDPTHKRFDFTLTESGASIEQTMA